MRIRSRGSSISVAVVLLAIAGLPAEAAPRVLLVSVDGLRADAVTRDLMPFFHALRARSASTLSAQSLPPTYTMPNNVSMLTGLTPETHGIMEVDDPGDTIVDGTILELAHDAGLSTALYISKKKLRLLHKPGTCDRYVVTDNGYSEDVVDSFLADLAKAEGRHDLAFVHLADLDTVGHDEGWMSDAYKVQLKEVDAILSRIFDALEKAGVAGETVVFVLSDHGGYGSYHQADLQEVKDVPWFATGPGIEEGREIGRAVGTHDVAPTALRVLGLPVPAAMEAVAVEEIFSGVGFPAFRRGDVDASKTVNMTDVIGILLHLFEGGDLACAVAADADANLTVNLTDPVYLLEHLFRGGEAPSAPYGYCGTASSVPSGLSCAVPCR